VTGYRRFVALPFRSWRACVDRYRRHVVDSLRGQTALTTNFAIH